MPTLDSVVSLVKLIGTRDFSKIASAVEQMAARERASHAYVAADRLETALRTWSSVSTLRPLPDSLKDLVWSQPTTRTLADLFLTPDLVAALELFLEERAHLELFQASGLPTTSTLLLSGPPGNGKTSLASALAHHLDLPFLSVKLHSLMDSYLGNTSKNVSKLFDFAFSNSCLLFLDEFDALGSQRQDSSSGPASKEYNVIVTTLLTNLDRFPDHSLLVAATNMPELLDPAITRRFALNLSLSLPSAEAISAYLSSYQTSRNVILTPSPDTLVAELTGHSWSTVERTCHRLHKAVLLGR